MTFQGDIKQGRFERPECTMCKERGWERFWRQSLKTGTFINVLVVDLHEDIWEFLILPSSL